MTYTPPALVAAVAAVRGGRPAAQDDALPRSAPDPDLGARRDAIVRARR